MGFGALYEENGSLITIIVDYDVRFKIFYSILRKTFLRWGSSQIKLKKKNYVKKNGSKNFACEKLIC